MRHLPILLLFLSVVSGRCGLSVSLSWEGSPDPNITNYVLYVGTAIDQWTEVINTGMALTSWAGSTNVPPLPLPPHTSTNSVPPAVSSANNTYTNGPPITMLPGTTGSSGNGAWYGCVYTNLTPGREYWFMVTAQDDTGMQSEPSNALNFVTPTSMQPLNGLRVFIP